MCISFTHVDDAHAHALNVKTLTAASGPPTDVLTKAKSHAYSSSVLANNSVHLPPNLYLFILRTALQCWAARRHPAHQPASSLRMPASSLANLLVLPSQPAKGTGFIFAPVGRAICFLLQEEKVFSAINGRIRKMSTSATSPPLRKDAVPMASHPVGPAAKHSEQRRGNDPADTRGRIS